MQMFLNGFIMVNVIIYTCRGEKPISYCSNEKPFLKNDQTCANFNEICVKIGDPLCENFRTACKQCPPSNYSVTMFLDMKDQMKKQESFKGEVLHKLQTLTNFISALLSFIIVIILLPVLFFLILMRRSRLIKRKYKNLSIEYDIMKTRMKEVPEINLIRNEEMQEVPEINLIRNEGINQICRKAAKQIDYFPSGISQSYKLKFQIIGQSKLVKLHVNPDDNIIKLKKQICEKFIGIKPNDYKKMKMKYRGVTLDDNQYLLSHIDSTQISIICEFDNTIHTSEIIVLRLRGNQYVPELVQINIDQTIEKLKIILFELNQSLNKDLKIFKETEELIDQRTIKDCNLADNDWIKVTIKETGHVIIKSIFDDNVVFPIEYSSTDYIFNLKEKLINLIKCNPDELVLFLNKIRLPENEPIDEFDVDFDSTIQMGYFMKFDEIKLGKIIYNLDNIDLYHATLTKTTAPKLVNKYSMLQCKMTKEIILNELIPFQFTKSHSCFIQIFGICLNKDYLYVVMENLIGGTMRHYLNSKWPLKDYEIYKWTKQMLEGLKYFHEHYFIMKDMNPLDILVDGNNIKLPSFNWTNYLNEPNYDELIFDSIRFVAPEILNKEDYGVQADVWSLGAVLVEIITSKPPYFKIGEMETAKKIMEERTIKYDENNRSPELLQFINSCLIAIPNQRATIDDLIKNELVQKY